MEYGLKDIGFYVKKYIAPRAVCYNFQLVRNKPLGAPTIVRLVYHMPIEVWDEITHPFPNFNRYIAEVWKWISNFIPHFIMDVIIYPCWD